MCAKCVDLEKKLRRYREIAAYKIDPQTTLSMRILIDELERERVTMQRQQNADPRQKHPGGAAFRGVGQHLCRGRDRRIVELTLPAAFAHADALSFINATQTNGQFGATSSILIASGDHYKIRSRLRKGIQPQRQLSKMFSLAMSPIQNGDSEATSESGRELRRR
jgi:hypothetical protein